MDGVTTRGEQAPGAIRRPGRGAPRWAAPLLALPLLWGTHEAVADTVVELGGVSVRVEAATASPAAEGGRSRLRFRVVNDGASRLHLTGVRSDVAGQADLVARTGEATETLLASFPIPAGEELDLTTSHLRYELHPLRRDLVEDETFVALLDFGRWSVEVPVHVHEPKRDNVP
jgi:copper(I)-binding protein